MFSRGEQVFYDQYKGFYVTAHHVQSLDLGGWICRQSGGGFYAEVERIQRSAQVMGIIRTPMGCEECKIGPALSGLKE